MINQPESVRFGEELDLQSLGEYLRSRLPSVFGEPEIEQFRAGSSNLTYLIKLGTAEYVLRRPPYGNTVTTAHDMLREFTVLTKLGIVYPPAPEPILFCEDESVIGAAFYLMERKDGLIIRGDAPAVIKESRENQEALCRSFMDNLAELHGVDFEFAGLGDLGKPEGYCRRQVEGWEQRYDAAKTGENPVLDSVMKWLDDNIPAESGAALIHNDYKFDNLMLDPDDLTRIVAVLDWEMVTIGDPLMDLGTTLGYWMSPDAGEEMLSQPFNPRVLMENFTRQDLVDMYAEAVGRELPNMVFYYAFGTFKVAVIAQQIYARYARGTTKDERFASYGKFAEALGRIGLAAIERGAI